MPSPLDTAAQDGLATSYPGRYVRGARGQQRGPASKQGVGPLRFLATSLTKSTRPSPPRRMVLDAAVLRRSPGITASLMNVPGSLITFLVTRSTRDMGDRGRPFLSVQWAVVGRGRAAREVGALSVSPACNAATPVMKLTRAWVHRKTDTPPLPGVDSRLV